MPQAIERSLATPMIRPFFPAMSCAADVMASFLAGPGHRDKMPVVEGLPALHIVVMITRDSRSAGLVRRMVRRGREERAERPLGAWPWPPSGRTARRPLRMVLLKGYRCRGFVFYTNYESRKGRQLVAHPKAAHAVPLEVAAPAGAARGAGDRRPRPRRPTPISPPARAAARSAPGPRTSRGRWRAGSRWRSASPSSAPGT